jgi:CubicO group peptidase (beta-lactamase class C family)
MSRLVIVAPLLLACAIAQAAPPEDIDGYVARAVEAFEVPGLTLAIVEDGRTTLTKGYGSRRLGESKQVDEHTIFPIASCTKAFTATALAILVDEGKLGWDDRVIDKLPGFRLYDSYATSEMTVRDLLVHRSGLGLGAGDLLWLPATDYSRRELMHQLRFIKPATSFRSGYAYDNVLYIVAGLVVEQVSGMTWENFVQKRIFDPLGMEDSVVSLRQALKQSNRVAPHARIGGEMRGLGANSVLSEDPMRMEAPNIAPAGAIYSSATDMARWLQVQLGAGAIGDKRVFSEDSARMMWEPLVIEPEDQLPAVLDLRKPNMTAYALGWNVTDYRGHKLVLHTGGALGGKAIVGILPKQKVAIALMINSEDGGARWSVFYRLLDHYLGFEPVDWTDSYRKAVDELTARAVEAQKKMQEAIAATPVASAGPSLPLEKYAGVYRDAWYGTVTIQHKRDALRIQFDHTPAMRGAVEHVRHDTFRTRFDDRNLEDTYLTFSLKPDGSIDQLKMRAVSPLADFSFDFHDLLFVPETKKD